MEDSKIIELFFQRNERAIKETEKKYGKLCHKIAYNILNNHEDSDECVNDTYIGLWKAIPPTKPDNLMAFVCKIARNLSLKRLEFIKREKRSPDVIFSLQELENVLPNENFAYNISDKELSRLISNFLYNEKEDVRNVFIRRYFFFDSIKEISALYSFSESKVKNMLFYTRNKLKDYLIKEGFHI